MIRAVINKSVFGMIVQTIHYLERICSGIYSICNSEAILAVLLISFKTAYYAYSFTYFITYLNNNLISIITYYYKV